jgi:poly-gamma-glutamate synthesis protein (capsule biosynthesis protein)
VARQLLADPSVDLILGHHVHVVQPARRIEGKWVAFGMGNLLSAQSSAPGCSTRASGSCRSSRR